MLFINPIRPDGEYDEAGSVAVAPEGVGSAAK
jgi:hypothetical protein